MAQLLAATTADPEAAAPLRDRFVAGRRAETAPNWRRVERGQLRPEVSADVAIAVLFAPILFRLLVGPAAIDRDAATTLAQAALTGLVTA